MMINGALLYYALNRASGDSLLSHSGGDLAEILCELLMLSRVFWRRQDSELKCHVFRAPGRSKCTFD